MEIPTGHSPSADRLAKPLDELRTWQRFHIKLISLYGGTVLAALMLMGWVFYQAGTASELRSLQQRLLATVVGIAATLDPSQIADTPVDLSERTPLHQALRARLKQVADQDADVTSIYILRPTGEPTKLRFFVDYTKDGEEGAPGEPYDASEVPIMLQGFARPSVEDQPYEDEFGVTLSGYAPVIDGRGTSVALVGVDVKATRIRQLRERVLHLVLGVLGVSVGVVVLVSLLVARSVRRPLTRIIEAATAIANGLLDTRIRMQRRDEFGIVGRHFDVMAAGLQERDLIRQTFGRYVSEGVARKLLAAPGNTLLGGEERVVSVLFCDLRGYSSISERLPPGKVVEMLNHYFGAMNELIDAHQGTVIEFLGDAIFAVFGAPNYISDHEERAVRCALAMRQRLDVLNREWEQSGLAGYWHPAGEARLGIRIGIHSGAVVAGNLGSQTRMKYAVIGDTVNVASRLEVLNKQFDSDICLSGDVFIHLPEELTALVQDRGAHPVRGREQAVRVYTL